MDLWSVYSTFCKRKIKNWKRCWIHNNSKGDANHDGKKYASKKKDSRTHIYEAIVEEKETKNLLIDKFISTLFNGSTSGMVLQALGNKTCSTEELNKIRNLIDDIESSQKSESHE